MTLRSRVPVLISELMSKGCSVTFNMGFSGPTISWNWENTTSGGHIHLDNFSDGVHGANSIYFEQVLVKILSEAKNESET